MRSVEKISLKEFVSDMKEYCMSYPTSQDFYNNLGKLDMSSLQSLSCEKDKDYLQQVNRILRIIMSIVAHPHISNKREEIVTRIEQAQQLSEEEFRRVLMDGSMWKRHNSTMIPETVYYYQHVDEIAIYENQFICLLIDLLDKDLSMYSEFYLALLPSYNEDHPRMMVGEPSQKLLRQIDLLRKRISFLKNTRFYKEISKVKRISRNVQRTNILLKDNLYKQTYRFYRQFISYENEGVAHKDLQMFYFVLLLKDLSHRGFVFDRSDTAYNRNIWSFSDSQFEIKLSFDKNNFGFDLVIFDRFSNETARHMLLLSPTISFSEIKEPEIKAWDTVEALSLWNRVDIEDHNKQPFEKIRTEAQLVGEWLDDKLAYSIANQDVYSHYCPVCKSKNIDIKNGVHTCQRCKSQYVFTHNKTRNTVLWFTKLRRIK